MHSVSFQKITKRYGESVVLDDFSLDINPGEFVTLLGPSGSGKTTALNILAGFTDPTDGRLFVGDKDILAMPPERRNIGMVFQSYSLFPHLTVFENIAFPLRLRKVSDADIRRRVCSALEMVHLSGYERRRPAELSGGQRQRVAFARAVVFEPAVLLMDEPLGALDLKLREAMQEELKQYHRQLGCTVVMVTHDQGEALALSDRIAVMAEGRIGQIGTPQQIYDNPTSKFVAQFIGRTNILTLKSLSARRWQLPELDIEFDHPLTGDGWTTDMVSLCLRPEQICRASSLHATALSFDAEVVEVIFLGDHVSYSLLAGQSHELKMHEARTLRDGLLRRGDKVRLGFEPANASVINR